MIYVVHLVAISAPSFWKPPVLIYRLELVQDYAIYEWAEGG